MRVAHHSVHSVHAMAVHRTHHACVRTHSHSHHAGAHRCHTPHHSGVVEVRRAVSQLLADILRLGQTHDRVDDLLFVLLEDVIAGRTEHPLYARAQLSHLGLHGGHVELVPKAIDQHVHNVTACFALDAL